eukprot:TRINITY_DN10297_c0_g1_i1.p1 TRINITY_DN10297_c0_g1~~TRINITY_DN10297_c0_g1_i1.p1  ORF type:complete len:342 (-),score=74.70 TRINITY_DN10297_c0_g1_i1:162-1187(-)
MEFNWLILLICAISGTAYLYFKSWQKRRLEEEARISEYIEEDTRKRASMMPFRETLKNAGAPMNMKEVVELLNYDPSSNSTMDSFRNIAQRSHCLFAKSAKVWATKPFDTSRSLHDNVVENLSALQIFLKMAKPLHLDGFLFEIPGSYNDNVAAFGEGVRIALSAINPECMRRSYIGGRGWFFEYDHESLFVTTFSCCYPDNHSRFTYGTPSGFVLLQPEFSFAWKEIGDDTPHTEWDAPKTMRDKIRVEFKKHGREYLIPDTVTYPAAHHIVKPLHLNDPVVEWWKVPPGKKLKERTFQRKLRLSTDILRTYISSGRYEDIICDGDSPSEVENEVLVDFV